MLSLNTDFDKNQDLIIRMYFYFLIKHVKYHLIGIASKLRGSDYRGAKIYQSKVLIEVYPKFQILRFQRDLICNKMVIKLVQYVVWWFLKKLPLINCRNTAAKYQNWIHTLWNWVGIYYIFYTQKFIYNCNCKWKLLVMMFHR